MIAIFFKTLPFFAIIGLGYFAVRRGMFTAEATAYLTKFVFYFALSAMLFQFSSTLSLGALLQWNFIFAYLLATGLIYIVAMVFALMRSRPLAEAAVEAQCGVIGNVGFLGIPMLAMLLGPQAVGYVMLVLAVDLIVFSSLIVIFIEASRDGRMRLATLRTVFMGLLKNPMIVSISLGLFWSAARLPIPAPLSEFVTLLGAAACPGALFAIGASLAGKSTERAQVAIWLSLLKLIVHPAAVAASALLLFAIEPYAASVMIAAAALPVAGNIYILAQHYNVAPQRVSASILMSTLGSVVTVSLVISWLLA